MKPLPNDATSYLRKLRAGLSSLPDAEQADIIAEVESHFRSKLENGSVDVLADFDAPAEYARQFLEERALSRAVANGSSLALGQALLGGFRYAAETLLVVVPLAVVQIVAVLTLIIGIVRPFYASHTGVFADDAGRIVVIGIGKTEGLHDVVGVATAPLFILVSVLILWVARRASLGLARRRLARTRTP